MQLLYSLPSSLLSHMQIRYFLVWRLKYVIDCGTEQTYLPNYSGFSLIESLGVFDRIMQICWYHFSGVVSELYDLPLLVVSWVIVPPFGGTKAYYGLIIGRIYNNSMETLEDEGECL